MLLVLTSESKCSELASLDIRFSSMQSEGARLVIPGLTKTSRTGAPKELRWTKAWDRPLYITWRYSRNNYILYREW